MLSKFWKCCNLTANNLIILGVGGYTGTYFPQWMSSPSLKGLTSLELVDCKNCLHLLQLGILASLKNLKISNMSHVIYLGDEFYNDGFGCLMALEALSLCLVLCRYVIITA
ncbi:putative disease resistance protein RGA3 [Trifolium repens]|jgi:hypothetical protein|nr:putative disease resistance protein RGA3 [Trifolium repens]